VRAFVWVIDRALEQPAASIRTKVPELGLQRAQLDAPTASEPIAAAGVAAHAVQARDCAVQLLTAACTELAARSQGSGDQA